MAGIKKNKEKLQKLYKYVLEQFIDTGIEFTLFYGTLLGYIRENDFIENDDDIDVIVNKKDYNKVMENISKKNLKTGIINQDIIQIFMNDIGPFDIYFYVFEKNNIKILWEKEVFPIKNIFPLKKINYYNMKINIPSKPIDILYQGYGESWSIPQKKGDYNYNKIIETFDNNLNCNYIYYFIIFILFILLIKKLKIFFT
jgi:phosphorylcholine metabolism protein LicD